MHKNPGDDRYKPIIKELRGIREEIKHVWCTLRKRDTNVICNCNCTCQGGGGPSSLCIATSTCGNSKGTVSVTIPPNACITKIYASFVRDNAETKYALLEIIPTIGAPLFCQQFVEEDAETGGELDTTLIQPLCVGASGAQATLTAFAPNGSIQQSALVTVTIVYCPDCCLPTD